MSKKQKTMHFFLKKTYIDPPSHFILDWPNKNIRFTHPANRNVVKDIVKDIAQIKYKLFDYNTILHIQYVPTKKEKQTFQTQPQHTQHTQHKNYDNCVPLLKSNFQKAIRRKLLDVALATAKTLLHVDPVAFLRRLPIVMIEDVRVHKSFAIIVWFMIAVSKGFVLTDEHIAYILGIVGWMCRCTTWHVPQKMDTINLTNILNKKVDINSIGIKTIVALQIRINYGGMPGDMHMIRNSIKEISQNQQISLDNFEPIDNVDEIEWISQQHIIPEAIDFHCYPWIIRKIFEKHPQVTKNSIKKAIWYWESSLNERNKHYYAQEKEKFKKTFQSIKQDLQNLKKFILNNTF